MEPRCILCDRLMFFSDGAFRQEETDMICSDCKVLSKEERKELRSQAMTRLLQQRASAR